MSNDYFKFKQFTVYHERCAMRVGTDGVLLGAWVSVQKASRVLDVGTGSGLIALQVAQRNSKARITAIEIDPLAAGQACENAARSPWADRIEVICADFKTYMPLEKFDLLVSNPPYFVDALGSPDVRKRIARHTGDLDYDLLFRHAFYVTEMHGHMAVIIPSEVERLALENAFSHGWFLCRRTNVYTKPGKKYRRLLLEFCKESVFCEVSDLYIECAEGGYSEEYKSLTRAFYLHME